MRAPADATAAASTPWRNPPRSIVASSVSVARFPGAPGA
jgi:hypothetical protein